MKVNKEVALLKGWRIGNDLLYAAFVYRFRTLAFHAGETGSIPVGRTNIYNIYRVIPTWRSGSAGDC